MMRIRSTKNQYRGINAHLHSLWQTERGWDEFHTSYIVYLTSALKALLLPMGYTAGIEQSLQIRRQGDPAGKPKSDVTIYDAGAASRSTFSGTGRADTHQMVMTLPEILLDEAELTEYRAVGIYKTDYQAETGGKRGEAVAWIELLSPSNKPGGQDDLYYRTKRLKLLESGLVFVELDFLHESPPTFSRVATYRQGSGSDESAHPYRIIVIDPRPVFVEGKAYLYQFDVDEAIPVVTIPLNGEDVVQVDFGLPYQKTFEDVLFGLEFVDYSQLPMNFERYSVADQVRIVMRMLAVLDAANRGESLDLGTPLAVETALQLHEGLARLQQLTHP